MLKKTITYEDFNGETVSEDLYFHLSEPEIVDLELSHKDGLSDSLQNLIIAEDGHAIMKEFKEIVLSSYGKKSADGRRFTKNAQLREEFESSKAYSTLFMELLLSTDAMIDFVQGIIPKGLEEKVTKMTALAPVPNLEPEIVTRAEMMNLKPEELQKLFERVKKGEVKIDSGVIAE